LKVVKDFKDAKKQTVTKIYLI